MPFAFFVVRPGDSQAESELNDFVRSHRVLTVDRTLVESGGGGAWYLAVEFLDGEAKKDGGAKRSAPAIDYKEKLSEEVFGRFSQMRAIRKTMAAEDSVPVYALFSNAQLAEMAAHDLLSLALMKNVEGLGEKKMERYGETFLKLVLGNKS
ncbi:MAG: HRDC domain-containing protein [Planctomycetota bacterium]